MAEKILIETLYDGQVLRLILNAPKANVLDAEMMSALQAALDALRAQPHVKMIQLQGTGDHFSFGASVAEHTREKAGAMLAQFHQLFYTLAELSIPTMALVSGQCLGGAMELALMCNLIYADSTARLGQPEIVLGVFPPPASILLPLKIGQSRAEELLISGRSATAEEAHALGFVNRVFESKDALEAGANDWIAKHVLPKSASSLRFALRAGRYEFNRTLHERLQTLERLYLDELMVTHDANEGIAAFMEKRQATWTDN